MKQHLNITIDNELWLLLKQSEFNISGECNALLWRLVNDETYAERKEIEEKLDHHQKEVAVLQAKLRLFDERSKKDREERFQEKLVAEQSALEANKCLSCGRLRYAPSREERICDDCFKQGRHLKIAAKKVAAKRLEGKK